MPTFVTILMTDFSLSVRMSRRRGIKPARLSGRCRHERDRRRGGIGRAAGHSLGVAAGEGQRHIIDKIISVMIGYLANAIIGVMKFLPPRGGREGFRGLGLRLVLARFGQ